MPTPARALVVTLAGMSVNLCLGILYAWSVWKKKLLGPAGEPMTGLDAGWHYLTDAEATTAFTLCGVLFALTMIPAGRLQDRYGPRLGASLAGLFLGSGCVLAGLMQSYLGLILGFGILGGIGMGLGYAAATPAAVKWFGPQRRGLIVGLVVSGYGAAAIYIAPLAEYLIGTYGLSGSFIGLGCLFGVVILGASQFLRVPPPGYVAAAGTKAVAASIDYAPAAMLKTWQYYVLVLLMIGSAQSGLLVIANASPMLNSVGKTVAFFAANAWLLASYGGFVNAAGRIGTGFYSDTVGRANAYRINAGLSIIALAAMPSILESKSLPLLFLAVGVVLWQYGGGLALIPIFTADFFGPKNLGINYGLVFLGWGFAFFVPQLAGVIKDATGTLDAAFYISAGVLTAAVLASLSLKRP